MNENKILEAIGIIVREHKNALVRLLKGKGFKEASTSLSDYELAYLTIEAVKKDNKILLSVLQIPLQNEWGNAEGDFDWKGLITSVTPLITGSLGAIFGGGSTSQQANVSTGGNTGGGNSGGNDSGGSDSGLSTGAIVGIAVGGLAVVVVLVLLLKKD